MQESRIIHRALGISYLSYENCRDTHFGMWCNKYANLFAIPLRDMVGNDHLFNWYCEQWHKLVELPFYKANKDYMDAGIEDRDNLQDLFLQYTQDIEEIYPKVFLAGMAKAHKEENYKTRLPQ